MRGNIYTNEVVEEVVTHMQCYVISHSYLGRFTRSRQCLTPLILQVIRNFILRKKNTDMNKNYVKDKYIRTPSKQSVAYFALFTFKLLDTMESLNFLSFFCKKYLQLLNILMTSTEGIFLSASDDGAHTPP